MKVVKRDGARVPFKRERLKQGIERACWKRPIPVEKIDAIVSEVERRIEQSFETEVDTHFLGELVMEQLREIDQVAYVRFASVYRQFKHAKDFAEEVRPMLDEPNG